MLYYVLAFISFLQSVLGFTLISSSVMLIKEPIKRRIVMGLSVMVLGICLLSYLLYALGAASVERVAVLFILGIEVAWFLICSGDRFFVSLFSFLTFVNVYVSIGFFGDTMTVGLAGNTAVAMLMVTRTILYLLIIPPLFKYKFPNFSDYRPLSGIGFFLGLPLGRFGLLTSGVSRGRPLFLGSGFGTGVERPSASSSSNTVFKV